MNSAFIARQPIFNRKLDVVGYELLFRGRGYAGDGRPDSPHRATATVVLNSFTELATPPAAPVLVSVRPEGGTLRRIGTAFSAFFRRLAGRTA